MVATRFYLNAAATPAILPTFSAAWNNSGSAARRTMSLEKTGSALATTSIADTTAVGVEDTLHRQFVSLPFEQAGTLSGTFSYVIKVGENNLAADSFIQVIVKIMQNAGTVRNVAFAGHTNTTVVATAGAVNQEETTGLSTRIGSAVALTSAAYSAGDVLVVEFGHRTCNATATAYAATMRFGDPPGLADFTLTPGDSVSDLVPWIEFSADLFTGVQGVGQIEAVGAEVLYQSSRPTSQFSAVALEAIIKRRTGRAGWGIAM